MIFILSFLLVAVLLATWDAWQNRHEWKIKKATSSTNQQLDPVSYAKIPIPALTGNKQNITFASITALVGAILSVGIFHQSPVFGLVFGGISPYILVRTLQSQRMLTYRKDGTAALEFAGAMIGAGGTIEEWIVEVVPRLEGKMRNDFQQAADQIRQRIEAPKVLERLIDKSLDPFFESALTGILLYYRNSNAEDLEGFIDEVMDELLEHEKFEQGMKIEQKSINQMLMFMSTFPALMYVTFRETVTVILATNWFSNVVLLLGLVGYIALFLFAARITKPQIF